MIDIAQGFDWDEGNREKCLKHGISIAEIESVFGFGVIISPDPKHSGVEDRLIAVNRNSEGRPMFVAFTLREHGGKTLVRPVSARYMHKEEAQRYEKGTSSQNG